MFFVPKYLVNVEKNNMFQIWPRRPFKVNEYHSFFVALNSQLQFLKTKIVPYCLFLVYIFFQFIDQQPQRSAKQHFPERLRN